MFSFFYQRYKKWFWFVLFLIFETGAISKSFHSPMWEVILNAAIGFISLGIFLRLMFRKQTEDSSNEIKNGRLVIVFTILGAFAGAAILPYLMDTLGTKAFEQLHLPLIGIAAIVVLQVAFMTFVTSVIGLGLAVKVDLDAPFLRKWLYEGKISALSKKWAAISVLGSFFGTLVIILLETFVFQPYIPQLSATPKIRLWKSLLSVFYGGIVEEVLVRLFMMTLLVWAFSRLQISQNKISAFIYWIAIILSSVLFGLGHLPATASLFGGLTPLLVIRAVICNGLLGILFGYLYWKKGLEYAILSHLSGDLFLHVILASLFSV